MKTFKAQRQSFRLESGQYIEFSEGDTILEALNKNKIPVDQSCEGSGSCGTCRVFIRSSRPLPPRNEVETERASDLNFPEDERLACQTEAKSYYLVKLPSSD